MQQVSQLYKDILAGNHWFEISVVIGDSGDPETGLREDSLFSASTKSEFFNDGEPCVGAAVSADADISMIAPDEVPRCAKISLYIRATNGTEYSEWLPQGVFYIDTREQTKDASGLDILTVHCYDAMLKAEVTYPNDSTHDYPLLDKDMVQFIADNMGIEVDDRTWEIMTDGYLFTLPVGYSMREVLCMIAAAYAGNFIITPTGKLRLARMFDAADTLDIGMKVGSLSVPRALAAYSGVEIYAGQDENGNDIVYTAGDETGTVLEITNDWGSPEQADAIYQKINGYIYQPFSAGTARIDPAVELCDIVAFTDASGGVYSVSTTFSSEITSDIEAPGEEEIDHEFQIKSSEDRKFERSENAYRSMLSITAAQITAEVDERTDQKVDDAVQGFSEQISSVIQQASLLESTVSEIKSDYVTQETLSSSIQQQAESIELQFSQVRESMEDADEETRSQIAQFTTFFRFEADGLYMGEEGSDLVLHQQGGEDGVIEFLRSGVAVLTIAPGGIIVDAIQANKSVNIGGFLFSVNDAGDLLTIS